MKRKHFLINLFPVCFMLLTILCCEDATGPEATAFDWHISSPENQNMDSQLITQAFEAMQNVGFVDCILIIRNGFIVGEKYFNGYNKNTVHNVKSVSKSFLSAITGIALRDGHLTSLNLKMLDFFPEYNNQTLDPRKNNITIQHLLMMRMGIDHERNNYEQIYLTENWLKTTIELPLLYDPGTRFSYNTFQTHLLSAIITKASKESTLEFATKNLFRPLNIDVSEWQQCPQGYYFGGNNMYFTPRNMARLGYLYLHGGMLNGEQIIPASWVQVSLTNYTQFINSDWGELSNVNYGYLWWLGEIKNHEVFLAIGYGGQFVINFPGLNMIVVTTAVSTLGWDTADQHERYILSIVANYIVPAITE